MKILEVSEQVEDDKEETLTERSASQETGKEIDKGKVQEEKKKKSHAKSIKEVQERLIQYQDQIKLKMQVQIDKQHFPQYFKYPLYESIKP